MLSSVWYLIASHNFYNEKVISLWRLESYEKKLGIGISHFETTNTALLGRVRFEPCSFMLRGRGMANRPSIYLPIYARRQMYHLDQTSVTRFGKNWPLK